MLLSLEVRVHDQAAYLDPLGEAQRVLKEVAARIAAGDLGGPLLDSGGGTIGHWHSDALDGKAR